MNHLLRATAALAIGVLLSPRPALAADVTYDVITGDSDVMDAWPGPDGLIGTADDFVDGNLSPIYGSAPNPGSYGYNAFDFVGDGSVPETERLPAGMNAATFIEGTVSIDSDVAASGGGPLVTGWTLSGTEPFPGHGAYSAEILAVNGGTYNPGTGAFTLNVDMRAMLVGGTADAEGFALTGTVTIVDQPDFGTPTGISYVDQVAVPLAQAAGAASVIVFHATGTIPASTGGTGGSFPEMPFEAALVGLSDTVSPVDVGSWGHVKAHFDPR